MNFPYALVISGQIEAKDHEHAHLIVQMSFALVGRLLSQPHTIAIQVDEPVMKKEQESNNG